MIAYKMRLAETTEEFSRISSMLRKNVERLFVDMNYYDINGIVWRAAPSCDGNLSVALSLIADTKSKKSFRLHLHEWYSITWRIANNSNFGNKIKYY